MNGKRFLVLVLAAMLVLSVAGCGKSQEKESNSTESSTGTQKEVKISIWNDIADTDGVQNNPIADEIAKKTGVRMNVVKGDSQKFQVLLAGGDLPEIIFTNGQLLDGKQLLPLDDLINQRGQNIKNNFPQILDYSKNYLSDDGKIYYLPVHIYRSVNGQRQVTKYGASVAFFGRWDIYAKIGYPNVTNQNEFLNMLKKMQDAASQTSDGKKVYALSGWTDWGIWPYYITQIFGHGYTDLMNDAMYSRFTGEIKPFYTSKEFWDGIKLFNKAYNMGILDPEAFTMKMDDYSAKVKAGQVLTTYASWWADEYNNYFAANNKKDWGFELLPSGMPSVPEVYVEEWPLGWATSYAHAITKNCKNPEKAMDLINFLYSEDGAKLVYRGIEGVHWQIVNGAPQMTKDYLEKSAADASYTAKEGFVYSRLVGYDNSQILSDGATADLHSLPSEIVKSVNPIDIQFAQHYGNFQYPGQAVASLVENGTYKTNDPNFFLAPLLVKELSDESKKILPQVDDYLNANIAKLIMAKDDAEFDSIKQKMINDINEKGYDIVVQEQTKLFEQAQQDAKSFSLK